MNVKRATESAVVPDGARPRALQGREVIRAAFTLVEMLVVIAIIGIVAAISVPALKNFQKGDAEAAATRQLLDDIARARQFAISQRSTVYMVFVPRNFWTDPAYNALSDQDKSNAVVLLDKQLVGYNFVSVRDVGDQPGVNHPRYLIEWRTLPEGMFIAEYKFNPTTSIAIPDPGLPTPHQVDGFAYTNVVPFPTPDAKDAGGYFVWMPYLAFNSLGQLITDRDSEVIPLARGTVGLPLDANKRPQYAAPTLTEQPANNSTSSAFTLIYVDRLTGRARVERQKSL